MWHGCSHRPVRALPTDAAAAGAAAGICDARPVPYPLPPPLPPTPSEMPTRVHLHCAPPCAACSDAPTRAHYADTLRGTNAGGKPSGLIADADTCVVELSSADRFLIIGCDGLWDGTCGTARHVALLLYFVATCCNTLATHKNNMLQHRPLPHHRLRRALGRCMRHAALPRAHNARRAAHSLPPCNLQHHIPTHPV